MFNEIEEVEDGDFEVRIKKASSLLSTFVLQMYEADDFDPEVISSTVNLSYHSETEESSDSYYGLVEEGVKSPETANFEGDLFDFPEPSNISQSSKLCASNRNKSDFDRLSFHSSSDNNFASDMEDKDSSNEAVDNVEGEDVYKFKETDSNIISQYVYEPKANIVIDFYTPPSPITYLISTCI